MAYRIDYRTGKKHSVARRFQFMAAGAILMLVLTVRLFWGNHCSVMQRWFLPEEDSVYQTAATVIFEGGGLRRGLVVLCQEVLREAGYAP